MEKRSYLKGQSFRVILKGGGGDVGEGAGGERGKVLEKPDPSISSPFPEAATRIDL